MFLGEGLPTSASRSHKGISAVYPINGVVTLKQSAELAIKSLFGLSEFQLGRPS